jgi:signal transduction histidine kinase
MSYAELVGIALFGLATAVAGFAMTAIPRAAIPGSALALGGLALTSGAVTHRPGPEWISTALFVAAGTLVLPVAVATYPRPSRHPVDVAALAVVVTSGSVALASATVVTAPWAVGWAGVVVAITVFLLLWWRMEHADDVDRRALVWLSLSLAVTGFLFFFVVFALDGTSRDTAAVGGVFAVSYGLLGLVGPAMYVGLRRPEVVDVRGLVVGVVVFLTAATAYMAVYAMVEGALELVGGESPAVGTMAMFAALVAALFHPLQVAMRGIIDELLFGQRPDPLGAAGQVAENIGDDPVVALDAIREALVLPYAQLLVAGRVVASSGTAVTHTRSLPLALGDGRNGELVVGLRPGDLTLTANDRRVLDLARPLLAQSLRAQLLAEDLQESREQVITAIEEERRRLRRDLHDGLGPRLSGIAFTSDAARNTLHDDPEAAAHLLRDLRTETAAAIQEIRELVYGMRPPALDELGLVGALHQQAGVLRTKEGRPLQVTIDAGDLPPLSAAVEVAAYRIVVEALSNVARHSSSEEATARLVADDGCLAIEVRDRGTGPGEWRRGVGLSSMRERAAELGGTLEAGYADGGGRVLAVLPL